MSPEVLAQEAKNTGKSRGAQLNNRNATKAGLRGYLVNGSLPKGASYVRRLGGEFHTATRDTVLEKRGELSLYDSALCQSAMRHEVRALLLQRWLRREGADLSVADRVKLMHEIGVATDKRDDCLRKLGLDQREDESPLNQLRAAWAAADRMQALEASKDTSASENAPETTPGALDGASTNTESER